jgi:hypothetical protein
MNVNTIITVTITIFCFFFIVMICCCAFKNKRENGKLLSGKLPFYPENNSREY